MAIPDTNPNQVAGNSPTPMPTPSPAQPIKSTDMGSQAAGVDLNNTNTVDLDQPIASVGSIPPTQPTGNDPSPMSAQPQAAPVIDPNIALKNNSVQEGKTETVPVTPMAEVAPNTVEPTSNTAFTPEPVTKPMQDDTFTTEPKIEEQHETPAATTLADLPDLPNDNMDVPAETVEQKSTPKAKSSNSGVYRMVFIALIVGIIVFSGILVYLLFLS